VVDYAHNESGLQELLRFARALMTEPGRLAAIIGTAGDREDEVLVGLARIAGRDADTVYIKENPRYLRGRELEDASRLMRAGLADAGALDRLSGLYPGEQSALLAALDHSTPGDAIVVMCVEEQIPILRDLRDRGAEEW
jgi:UDP-N-acetylmuramyl tripeptide synthase